MKKTGQILKEAREAKSISLQEISIHLKINTKTLKALEMGDKNQLPAKTFLRGFVQSYAQFLKLDLDQIMETFQEEMGTTHPGMITTQELINNSNAGGPNQGQQNPTNNLNAHFQSMPKAINDNIPPKKSEKSVPNPKTQINEPLPPSISFDPQTWSHSLKIVTAVFVFLIISGIIFAKKTIDKYQREATLPKQESTELDGVTKLNGLPLTVPSITGEPIASADITGDPSSLAPGDINPESGEPMPNAANSNPSPGQTKTQANAQASAQSTGIQSNGSQSNTAGTIPPNLNISREALAISSKPEAKLDSKPEAKPIASPSINSAGNLPGPTPTAIATSNDSPQEIIIEALDKVVVEYSIDGGPKSSLSLLAEKIHTFKAKKNITLSFSDGGSVNLIHNGKDKGVPGNLGQPYLVSFPQ